MSLTMYERIGHEGRSPSPFSWRIRYAFANKGVEPQFRQVRFVDVETILALSGQQLVPIITDGHRVVHDSWNIACHLEERHCNQFCHSDTRVTERHYAHIAPSYIGDTVWRPSGVLG